MALSLELSTCVINCCTKLLVTDITGLGTTADGTSRWADTVTRAGITSATIQIVLPNGSDLFVTPMVVTTTVQNATTYDFTFALIDPSGDKFIDGIYEITYTIVSGGITYVYNKHFSITCNARCCLDKLWAAFPDKLCSTCDYEEYLNECLEAEGLLEALNSSSCCGLEDNFDKILELLETICDQNDCGCD